MFNVTLKTVLPSKTVPDGPAPMMTVGFFGGRPGLRFTTAKAT